MMSKQNPYRAALDFLLEVDEGRAPEWEQYLGRCTGDAVEMLELVADCVILDALALPPSHQVMAYAA